MTRIDGHLEDLKKRIPVVNCLSLSQDFEGKAFFLIDVRESDELNSGIIRGAHPIARGFLELKIESILPDKTQKVLVYCEGGTRSLLAARDLIALGYQHVYSLAGGFNEWKNLGLEFELPKRLSYLQRERYLRHLRIPEVGEKGQIRLLASKVLLVGAGGLGSPIALYLTAAGVGEIGIIDPDIVDRSNLQRQIIHKEATIGRPKVESAQAALKELNPEVKITPYQELLSKDNAESLIKGYDLVIDGTDNFTARYLVNDTCVKLGKANIHGSILRFEGQVSVFWPASPAGKGPCYRCLFPEPPPPDLAPSCAEAGVLGVLPGVIGMLEAVEALKILLGIGDTLVGRLLCYDALKARFQEYGIEPDPGCPVCQG